MAWQDPLQGSSCIISRSALGNRSSPLTLVTEWSILDFPMNHEAIGCHVCISGGQTEAPFRHGTRIAPGGRNTLQQYILDPELFCDQRRTMAGFVGMLEKLGRSFGRAVGSKEYQSCLRGIH